ncbi:hypothetical protein ABG067_003441 [Albugo candida]
MDTNGQCDSIVLEEEIDPNYEPSEKEVIEYATWLGMNLVEEKELFWIAREGLKAPLPENWKPCKTTDTEEIYYFNFSSGESTWEHPCDEYYRNLYQEHKKKSLGSKMREEPNERKKKEQEDVAELLGKKGTSKKKKNLPRKAVEAGRPSKNELGSVIEKKPLGGISKKLSSVSSAAELTSRKLPSSEHNDVRDELRAGPSMNFQTLSKPPLISLSSQKESASNYNGKPGTTTTNTKEDIERKRTKYEEQKRILKEAHEKTLVDMNHSHQEQLEKCSIGFRQEIRIMQEEQEREYKSSKAEYERKRNVMENEMDRNENALSLERKEKIKRIETETQFVTSVKKNELQKTIEKLEREQKTFLTNLQEKFEKERCDCISDIQRKRQELTNELEDTKDTQTLREENEALRRDLGFLGEEIGALKDERETLLAEMKKLQDSTSQKEYQAQERSPSTFDKHTCTNCENSTRMCQEWQAKYNDSIETIDKLRDQISALQRHLTAANEQISAADANVSEGGISIVEESKNLQQIPSDWSIQLASLQEQLERKERALEEEIKKNKKYGNNDQLEIVASKRLLDAQNKITMLSDQVEGASKWKEETEKKMNEINDERRQSEMQQDHEMRKAQQRIECLTDQLSVEREARKNADSSISELNTEIGSFKASTIKAKEDVDAQKRLIEDLERERNLLLQRLGSQNRCTGEDTEATESLFSVVEKQKGQVDRLEALIKSHNEEKNDLIKQIEALNGEVDQVTIRLREAEADKDREILRGKQKEAELENLHARLQVTESEIIDVRKDLQKSMIDSIEYKAQLNRLGNSERMLQEKLAFMSQNHEDWEEQKRSLEHELGSSRKELRAKCILLDDQQNRFNELCNEKEMLQQQLDEVSSRSGKTRNTTMTILDGEKWSAEEIERARLLQSQLADSEMRINLLEQDRANRAEKQRELTQKYFEAENKVRDLEDDKQNLHSDSHKLKLEVAKWKDKAEQADKECAALNAKLMELQLEKETLEFTSQNLLETERRNLKVSTTLQNTIETLEKQLQDLIQQLFDEKTAGRSTAVELHGSNNRCKRLENELLHSQERNKQLEHERNDFESKYKAQEKENRVLENHTRSMQSDAHDCESKIKLLEDTSAASMEKVKLLEAEVLEQQTKCKKEREDKECAIRKIETEKMELEEVVISCKRRAELSESRANEVDSAVLRADFQSTMKLQQLQNALEASNFARTSLENKNRVLATDLVSYKESVKSASVEIAQTKEKLDSVTKENRELQETLLMINTMKTQSEASVLRTFDEIQLQHLSTNQDVTLVKSHLADVNTSELESHLADVTTKLENANRRAAVMEDRCKHQTITIESLHVEISSLRSSLQKLHLSAMEALPSIERMEYEHKKRLLRMEYQTQLGAFQEREEQAFIRNKARSRAKYEKELDELIADLERQKEQRMQHEQDLCMQLIQQLREQHNIRLKEIKRQWKNESRALENERKIKDREHVDKISRQLRQENDEASSSIREQKRHLREQMLDQQENAIEGDHLTDFFRSAPAEKHSLSLQPDKMAATSRRGNKYQNVSRKWQRRIKVERALIQRASKIASRERDNLSHQHENLRNEKKKWRQDAASCHSAHDRLMLQEMKNIIDQNALNYNMSIRRLRDMENRIHHRQQCVRQMEKTVERLANTWSTKHDRVPKVPVLKTFSETEEDVECDMYEESIPSDEDAYHSDSSDLETNQNDSTVSAIIRKLERIDEKLLAGDKKTPQASFFSSTIGNQLHLSNSLDAHRMPLSREGNSVSSGALPRSMNGLPRQDNPSWAIAPQGNWNCARYPVFAQPAWNQMHATSFPFCPNSSNERFSGLTSYHRQINNWAQGRQKVQRAAKKQAAWLSNLSKEIQEYKTNTNLRNFEKNTLLDESI